MDRIELLCRLQAKFMLAFSEETIIALSKHTLLQLFLPKVKFLIEANVAKEVEKNRAVIVAAANVTEDSENLPSETVDSLLFSFRQIDDTFCSNILGLPIKLNIHYELVDPIRLLRLNKLSGFTIALLHSKSRTAGLRQDIQQLYTQVELKSFLSKYLLLYAEEVKLLILSLKVPWILELSRNEFSRIIENSMYEVANSLAERASEAVFQKPHALAD